LSWADVADPAVFNPRNFPLVVQTGGEHYSSTGPPSSTISHKAVFLSAFPTAPFRFTTTRCRTRRRRWLTGSASPSSKVGNSRLTAHN
jgi:hypothetical protein